MDGGIAQGSFTLREKPMTKKMERNEKTTESAHHTRNFAYRFFPGARGCEQQHTRSRQPPGMQQPLYPNGVTPHLRAFSSFRQAADHTGSKKKNGAAESAAAMMDSSGLAGAESKDVARNIS